GQLIAQNINTYFESQQTAPFQKLYLHTDREFYFTGDTLWFAAYLVEGQTNKPESESCNLYVDLINEEGEIVKDELFLIQNGFGSGYISFSDTVISEGNYLLRAYTDYLKNFGDKTFFTKIIQVSAIKNSFEFLTQDTIKTISPEIDVSFLPEGGFLLAEESNCVAFKAVDQSGKGKEISGKLLDEKGDLILTFKSVFKGAGKFYFYPKGDKKYTAKIDGYPNLTFQLPEIQETGAKIQLINQDESKIQMVVQGKNNNRNQSFYLVCSSRGEGLFYEEINQQKMNVFLKIDNEQLRTGINRFVLLDNNLNPISERLVFKEDLKLENIEIRLNNESFSTREEVQVNLKPSEFFVDEMAQVSISVIDENYVNASGVSQNIASYFLLDSELNGHIESPADYFISDEKLNTQTKLDLLMTTNGWSNYIWNSLKADSLKIEFERQLGFSFKGNVKRGIGNKALTEGNVFLMVKSDSTAQFLDMPLDENGNLEFRNIVFYDSASVFAQARNKRDNHRIQFEMQMPEIIPPEVNFSKLKQLQRFSAIPLSIYRLHYLNEMRLKEFHQDKNNILIQEIEVTAKKSRPKYRTGAPLKNHGPYLLTETMTAGTTNILEYLAYRVIGVRPTYDKISGLLNGVSIAPPLDKDIEINKGKVGFFLDEFMYLSSAQVIVDSSYKCNKLI
ncbi:MAG: hypothetical protein HQ522_08760, partial [Bacteroidetes bacterium]|nr:hypothetical protein [Bacteroidota bacterium]